MGGDPSWLFDTRGHWRNISVKLIERAWEITELNRDNLARAIQVYISKLLPRKRQG